MGIFITEFWLSVSNVNFQNRTFARKFEMWIFDWEFPQRNSTGKIFEFSFFIREFLYEKFSIGIFNRELLFYNNLLQILNCSSFPA